MRTFPLLLAVMALSGCVQHRLIVAEPNPNGIHDKINSGASILPKGQPRTVADCNTNLIDEVRVHQNIGQSFISLITLGLYMPTTIEYFCANIPSEEGSTDN